MQVLIYNSALKVVAKNKCAPLDWSGNFDAKGAPDADTVKTIAGVYGNVVYALVAKSSK